MYKKYFPNPSPSGVAEYIPYWSSTTYLSIIYSPTVGNAWTGPSGEWATKDDDGFAVRAVRGGQVRLPGHLIILTPSQSSAWEVGQSITITWKTQEIDENVSISISRQGGLVDTFETITESTPNDGTYEWTVTGTSSVNCVLRVEPVIDSAKGTTQGFFRVVQVPSVETLGISAITSTGASGAGNIANDGAAKVIVRGVCWSTSANPTISGNKTADGTGTGSFTSSISELTPGTTYHVRAFATNSVGTAYGEDVSFTTLPKSR
jgi:hypothetical protein